MRKRRNEPVAVGLGETLVERAPHTVGELADALHLPLRDRTSVMASEMWVAPDVPDGISTVTCTFRWDMHHERPVETKEQLAGRTLETYSVGFKTGRTAFVAAVSDRCGAPDTVAGCQRWNQFFVKPGDGEHFRVEWYAREPDWAIPPVDEQARAQALADLLHRVASAGDDAAAVGALRDSSPVAGIRVGGGGPQLVFEPPIPAAAVVAAIGMVADEAIGRTTDVHMSSWDLARLVGTEVWAPTVGAWLVRAHLRGSPSGGDFPGMLLARSRVGRLGEGDMVGSLSFSPASGAFVGPSPLLRADAERPGACAECANQPAGTVFCASCGAYLDWGR
jgi:hypothetical protein